MTFMTSCYGIESAVMNVLRLLFVYVLAKRNIPIIYVTVLLLVTLLTLIFLFLVTVYMKK